MKGNERNIQNLAYRGRRFLTIEGVSVVKLFLGP